MDASLSRLLQQLYGSGQPLGPSTPMPEDGRPGQLSTDDFRMFVYKVMPCTRRGPHSWVECAFCHPGEKAARRCPQKHAYMPLACPNLKRDGRCPQGDSCHFAHSLFEYWLHPARYRTQLCSYGVECKRSICFFAHHAGELRITEHTAQLLALEKELESADPSCASSNAKWGINSTPPSPHNRNNGGVRQVGEGRNGGRGGCGAGAQGHGSRQQGQQSLAGQLGMGLGLGEGLDGQLAQLRHLQALQQQQQQGPGRARQGFMGALGPDMDPFTFPGRQEQGAGTGAFGNQASGAALLEAALQQRSAAAAAAAAAMHADSYGGAAHPRQHQQPQYADGSVAPQADAVRQQHQMTAAMRMLLNLSLGPNTGSAAGAGAPRGACGASGRVDRLQTYGSLPASAYTQPPPPPPHQQHQQLQLQGSDTQQAMQLIAQLQQLAEGGGVQAAPGAPASLALQSLLLSGGLPHLLSQLGGTGPAAHTQATALAQQMHEVQVQMQMQQHQQQAMLMQQQQQQQHQQQAMRGMPQLGSVASMQSFGAPLPAPARPLDDAAASAALFGCPSTAVKCPPSKPNSSGSPSPANALSVRTRHTAGSSVSSGASDGTRSPPLSHHSDEGVWAVREGDQWGFRRASLGSDATIAQPIRTFPGQQTKLAPPAPAASELGPFSSMAAYRALGDSAAPAPAAGDARVRLPLSLDDGELGLASGMADMAGASAMIASLSQLVDGPSSL